MVLNLYITFLYKNNKRKLSVLHFLDICINTVSFVMSVLLQPHSKSDNDEVYNDKNKKELNFYLTLFPLFPYRLFIFFF